VLDIHLKLDKVFEQNFGFSLDLQQLTAAAGPGALAGMDFVGHIADVLNPGAGGQIDVGALLKLQIQAGIDFSGDSPVFFLYDYNPTREQTVALAAFGAANFTARSSTLSTAQKDEIKAEFEAVLAEQGDDVTAISAVVESYWVTGLEAGNTDDEHGAGQLSGQRQTTLIELAEWLSTELGVTVQLFAGEQREVAEASDVKLFTDVEVTKQVAVPAEQARGTYATVGLRIAGQDLELSLEAGPAKLGVVNGSAAIDADGIASTKDYATFTIMLDQKPGGSIEDDGRFDFTRERISDNFGYEIKGHIGVNLPIALDLFGASLPLDALTIATGSGGIGAFFDSAAGLGTGEPTLTISVPDVQSIMDQYLSEFSLLGMLADPTRMLDGIDIALGEVQDMLTSEFSRDIPIIGTKMAEAGNFVRDVRTGLLADLR
ncbi:MAG: hypothetical protein EBS77_10500, partial [Gammaproteobacteria bacterium]|nr:hypothetical protein [Gammaproteobacteria bacterium]